MKKNTWYTYFPELLRITFFKIASSFFWWKRTEDFRITPLTVCSLLLLVTAVATAQDAEESAKESMIRKAHVGGYMITQREKVDESYNAGYSMYAAARPLLREYSGRSFQSGLFGIPGCIRNMMGLCR